MTMINSGSLTPMMKHILEMKELAKKHGCGIASSSKGIPETSKDFVQYVSGEWVKVEKCCQCKSPALHESTSHRLSDTMILCGPCAKKHFKWLKGQYSRRVGKLRFYDYAYPPGIRSGSL